MKQSEVISLSTAELQVKLSELKKTYAELNKLNIKNEISHRTNAFNKFIASNI
jgi:ribosomal protein L29